MATVNEQAEPVLGPAPSMALPAAAPAMAKPGATTPRKDDANGNVVFTVNGNSREEVREFYNGVYLASENVPMESTANDANCFPGTNSAAFQDSIQWRINWFRALAGIPADITFSDSEATNCQSAALMLSVNNMLAHSGVPLTWSCFATNGTNALSASNIALGLNGPDAITGYVWDYGMENYFVGHRRFILYPQTQVMATGDVPAQDGHLPANDTFVIDSNYGGPRPATTHPFVAWPPPGYVPYQVVFPQWSFAMGTPADIALAEITMLSNGVPMAVQTQRFSGDDGEDTIVWYPAGLDYTSYNARFPFDGNDTVYTISISNIIEQSGTVSVTYCVTNFDPAVPGPDYVPPAVTGPAVVATNLSNNYSVTPSANPNTTGYQWLVASLVSGNLTDNATSGLKNFTMSPAPLASVISNAPVGSGKCFHLTHHADTAQLLEFNETVFPATNTTLKFQSYLGLSTASEVARVQVSTDAGKTWTDIFTQAGPSGQSSFSSKTLSLAKYAGEMTQVRFNYDYIGSGSYYSQTAPGFGWSIQNIALANAGQLVDSTTNYATSPQFTFVPTQPGSWALLARPVIFGLFGLNWSAALAVETPPAITSQPANVTVAEGGTATFRVGLTGPGTFSYQWQFNGTNIPAATNSACAVKNAQLFQAGSYDVVVATGIGGASVTSSIATLTVTPTLGKLHITGQPQSISAPIGGEAFFSVSAIGESALSYRWAKNGASLSEEGEFSGTTNPVLAMTGVQPSDAGSYSVVISDDRGTVKSAAAVLTVEAAISVVVSGNGTVSPNYGGKTLPVGKTYTMTAKAGPGAIFAGWGGAVITNSAAAKFIVESNMSFTATFVTNPFIPLQGSYYGLFWPDGSPRNQTNSGAVTLTVSSQGALSGKLTIGTNTPSLTGQFSLDGLATIVTPRKGSSTLTTTLQLNAAEQTISGAITDGSFTSSLLANQQVFSTKHSAINYAGKYTLVIPGQPISADGPFGASFGTATVATSGAITFSGTLADGTAVSQSSYVSEDGYWPLYIPLYSGNGSLLSWNYFGPSRAAIAAANAFGLSADASWICLTNKIKTSLYRAGFTNDPTPVYASTYASSNTVNLTNGQVTLLLENGFTDTIPVNISKGKVTLAGANTNKLSLTISPSTGAISGTFTNGSKTPIKISGMLLQSGTNAAGYFSVSNTPGLFLLRPPSE